MVIIDGEIAEATRLCGRRAAWRANKALVCVAASVYKHSGARDNVIYSIRDCSSVLCGALTFRYWRCRTTPHINLLAFFDVI